MSGLVQDATGNDLTYRIIGAAMGVHNRLGHGYKEEVYEKALAAELLMRGIYAVRQFPVEVNYEGVSVALFYLDLLFVDGKPWECKDLRVFANHSWTAIPENQRTFVYSCTPFVDGNTRESKNIHD